MSKIFKVLLFPFKLLYKLIDYVIVTPISKLVYKVDELLKDNSIGIEKLLNRPNVLVYVALALALLVFFLVDAQVINLTDREAEVIYDQPVQVEYNKEMYVVEGVPESVDITLIGSKSAVYLATSLGDHEVKLDLTNYGVGTYKVNLKYNHSITSVSYKLDPSTVTIKISEKKTVSKSLTYELMKMDKLDAKLSVSAVTLDTNTIFVKSSQEIIDKIAVVKALVDASVIPLTNSGDYTIDEVKLAAYDENGNLLENVEMVPSKVSATVTVDSYHATKPVKIVARGTITNGKAIADISSSVKEVTVYGDKDKIEAITNIEAILDVSSISSNGEFSLDLIQPSGVRYMTQDKTTVKVTVGDSIQKTLNDIIVHTSNLGSGLVVNAATDNDKKVNVIIKGVASVVNNLETAKVYAYVDLTGLGVGTHTVPVYVTVEDERVEAQPITTEINVKITQK